MKNLTYLLLSALLLSITLFMACDKQSLAPNYTGQLIASSTQVTLNQPDSLVVVGAENDAVTWSVSPEGYTIVKKQANKIILFFTAPGVYTITASVNGGKPLTATISSIQLTGGDATVPITGENLVVTPKLYKLPTTDSTYFNFTFQSSKTYPCGSGIFMSLSQNNHNYIVTLNNIFEPAPGTCTSGPAILQSPSNFFYPVVDSPIVLGTSYPLTISVAGQVYAGSIIFSKTYMDITWNYTSGVTMSSKHITL